jgi:hypothetical protein
VSSDRNPRSNQIGTLQFAKPIQEFVRRNVINFPRQGQTLKDKILSTSSQDKIIHRTIKKQSSVRPRTLISWHEATISEHMHQNNTSRSSSTANTNSRSEMTTQNIKPHTILGTLGQKNPIIQKTRYTQTNLCASILSNHSSHRPTINHNYETQRSTMDNSCKRKTSKQYTRQSHPP